MSLISKNNIVQHYEKIASGLNEIRLLPRAVEIIYDLISSTEISYKDRRDVYFAFGYLIHDDDDIPERSLEVSGLLDDFVICMHVINNIINIHGKEIIYDCSDISEENLEELINSYFELYSRKGYLKKIVKKYF